MAFSSLLAVLVLAIGAQGLLIPGIVREVTSALHLRQPKPTGPSLPSPSSQAKFNSYTAIGDSWCSGAGPFTIDTTSKGGCTVTQASWPYQFNLKYGSKSSSFDNICCPGTNTSQAEQSVFETAFGTPTLVTMEASGNDEGWFTSLVENCILAAGTLNATAYKQLCDPWLTNTAPAIQSQVHTALDEAIAAAKSRSLPSASVGPRTLAIIGYAQPYSVLGNLNNCPTTLPTPPLGAGKEADLINQSVIKLNNIIQTAATNNDIHYVDIDTAFQGHRLCDSGELFFQVNSATPNVALFHPTLNGHLQIVNQVAKSLGWL